MAESTPAKPIHSLILDTGPLIKNAVSVSTIINSAEEIFTTPAIISEIRDEATRSRVQTTLMPFLKIRTPSPASYDAVVAFSKKTGDHAVLSRQDLGILALAYEIHCERNGGSWGLREAPKQPVKLRPGEKEEADEDQLPTSKRGKRRRAKALESRISEQSTAEQDQAEQQQESALQNVTDTLREPTELEAEPAEQPVPQGITTPEEQITEARPNVEFEPVEQQPIGQENSEFTTQATQQPLETTDLQENFDKSDMPRESTEEQTVTVTDAVQPEASVAEDLAKLQVSDSQHTEEKSSTDQGHGDAQPALISEDISHDVSLHVSTPPSPPATSESDSESDGEWITPSNLNARQAADAGLTSNSRTSAPVQMDVATMTIDFAMQNVLLQMNLHLLSTNMQRIKHLTSKVLRCHACFLIVKQLDKQFCPRCGGASLRRVSCSTNTKGEFTVHLAKNYQYNKRGDRYSVPKPIAGTANGKWSGQGGGQGGWGRDLILAEDQKEYQKQMEVEKRKKGARDLMDDDYLPGILTGDRAGRSGGRVKVGAGRNVNSKKR